MAKRGKRKTAPGDVATNRQASFRYEFLEKLEFFCVIDFFMSETARHANVILPGSLHEEDEGTVTTAEGRVIRIRQAVQPPGQARPDWEIICDLARRFAPWEQFPYACVEDIFRELRRVSRGGLCDYYGITYEKIERQQGPNAKVEIALARGKDVHDKRETIRRREQQREVERALRDAQR